MKTKKVSMKRKRSWRKHIDVSDVDAYFEDERLIERSGKKVEDKSDAELFQIDTRPKNLIRDSILAPKKTESNPLQLRCLQGLENSSAVQDPLVKRNTVRSKEERQHPALKKKNEIRTRMGILKKKEIKQLEKYCQKRLSCFQQKSRRRIAVDKDLWDDENENKSKLSRLKRWFSDTTYLHAVRNTSDLKEASDFRPAKPKNIVSTFEVPHPGTSYNPTFKDHLDLANEIVLSEVNMQKEEAHLTRVTQKLFRPISAAENEKNWIQEMTEGLPMNTDKNVMDKVDNDSDTEYKAINPPVNRDKKKTIKQRKKELRRKQEELKRKEVEEQKKKASDICKVQKILQEIKEEEIIKTKRELKRLRKSSEKFKSARRVGRNKFVSPDPVVSDVNELTGSLRKIVKVSY